MNNNELYHYGVLGMKWGVRRSLSNKEVKALKSISKDTSEGFKSASNIANTAGGRRKPSKKLRKEMSIMSDQELRARINRLNMEQQYSDLNPSRTARGASIAKSTLEVAGSVAAIAGSAFGIMLAVKQLKG